MLVTKFTRLDAQGIGKVFVNRLPVGEYWASGAHWAFRSHDGRDDTASHRRGLVPFAEAAFARLA